jgi:hypothetical protein
VLALGKVDERRFVVDAEKGKKEPGAVGMTREMMEIELHAIASNGAGSV